MSNAHPSVLVLLAAVLAPALSAAQTPGVWWEDSGKEYPFNLGEYRILIIVGDNFDFLEATVIRDRWLGWGAQVEVAGATPEVVGHVLKPVEQGWDNSEKRPLAADLLIRDVDPTRYHALFFPGGRGPADLLANHGDTVKRLVREAHAQGTLVTGLCHGPLVLAASGVLAGRKATGFPDTAETIVQAGGEYVEAVTVSDGNVLTGNWPHFESFAVAVAEKLLDAARNGQR